MIRVEDSNFATMLLHLSREAGRRLHLCNSESSMPQVNFLPMPMYRLLTEDHTRSFFSQFRPAEVGSLRTKRYLALANRHIVHTDWTLPMNLLHTLVAYRLVAYRRELLPLL